MTEIFALDLDEELISHIVDPNSWIIIQGENFDTELIEDPFVVEVFTWQKWHQREHGRIATPTVLCDEFNLDLRPPETSVGDLLDRMRLRFMRNGGRTALRRVIEETKSGDPLLVPQMLIRTGRELTQRLAKRGEVFGTGDFDRAMHRYDLKVEAGPGASFGHPMIDHHLYGMRGLNFLIAWKKSYKTWQMIQSAVVNAEEGRYPWLYSLEMPAEETDMRFRFMLAGIPWWKWVRNALSIEDRKILKEVSELIDGLGMYRIVKPPRGQRGIAEMVNNARDAGSEIVLIDQLQYIETDHGGSLGARNDTGDYFAVLDDARNLSDEGPIYITHQFGRGAMGADSMPDISLAKGSSSIEEVCTVALGMWANQDMRRSGKIEIGTLMSRNADFGSWEMEVELSNGCSFDIVRKIEEE